MVDYQRLTDLRNSAIVYVLEHGAGKVKGYVPVHELQQYFGTTLEEWQSLYLLLLMEEKLAKTSGDDQEIYLTDHGRSEAKALRP